MTVEADGRTERNPDTFDPVTFEVLKNAFVTVVDEMAEQILRTCHSFVIWARDFSNALCDAEGNTDHAGQPGHRRSRRHPPLHRQGRRRGLQRATSIPVMCSP